MNVRLIYLSVVMLLLQMFSVENMSAQISSYSGLQGTFGLSVLVVDSLSMKPLPAVTVSAVQKKDTLYASTDESGNASITRLTPRDSVTVSVSLLGYKSLTKKIAHKGSTMVTVVMAEDPVELNAIIVRDDAVLMVSRGDTTVYNPASLKLPEGSDLEALLKKLPGVDVENGAVLSMGRNVNKILLNGNTLFGADISAALRLVMSDMVKNVKIYEQHDQDRLIEADTLKKKDLVADIITKDKVTTIQVLELMVAAGVFSDKELMGSLHGKFDVYEIDKPTINAEVIAARNSDVSGPVKYPADELEARLKYRKKKQFKYEFFNFLGVKYSTRDHESFRDLQYYGIDRKETSSSVVSGRELSLRDNMNAMLNIGKSNRLDLSLNLEYTGLRESARNNDSTLYNDQLYRSFLTETDNSRNFRSQLRAGIFSVKDKSFFGIWIRLPFDVVHSTGDAVDTLKNASYRQFLKDDIAAWRITPGIDMDYSLSLCKGLSLKTGLKLSHLYSQDTRTSRDFLLDVLDPFNSYDYTNNSFNGNLEVSLNYMDMKGLSVHARMTPKVITQATAEHVGAVSDNSNCWFLWSPSFRFDLFKSSFNVKLSYKESESVPTVSQLRSTVRFSNPLYLSAGNPDLKVSVARDVSLSTGFTSFKTGTVWTLNARYRHTSDLIGNNTVYYDAPVLIPEYGYEAMAGSRLTRPENIGSAWRAGAGLKSSFSINKIASKMDVELGTTASRTPFMTDSVKSINGQDEVYAQLKYASYFSKVFNLDMQGRYAYGANMLNSSKVYDYSAISADIRSSVTIASSVVISASYVMNAMFTDREGYGYLNDYLNASVKYVFGKDRRFAVSLNGTDLLNNSKSESVSVTELYLLATRQSFLGRCVYASFSVKIR